MCTEAGLGNHFRLRVRSLKFRVKRAGAEFFGLGFRSRRPNAVILTGKDNCNCIRVLSSLSYYPLRVGGEHLAQKLVRKWRGQPNHAAASTYLGQSVIHSESNCV